MNRELQQVRRYWPRARYAGWNWHGWQSEDEPGVLYMRYSSERRWWRKRYELCLDEEQGGWRVIDSNQDQLGRGATIAEAMRAAGFGGRLPGIRAIYRRGPARVPLADRQRPSKGARLGKRKRQSDATPEASPKWYAVAATYPRYELRHGAEVLTVVSYSRADGMWSTERAGGFIRLLDAMHHEEQRLNLPDCPVAEVQP